MYSSWLFRFYVFDYELKTFTLIGRGTFNERCVLCVGHFFHATSTQTRLIVYASDTAGYISFWDVTHHYFEYFRCQSKDIRDTEIFEEKLKSIYTEEGDSRRLGVKNDSSLCNFRPQKCVLDGADKIKSKEDVLRPFCSYKLHQSGVNSISLMVKGEITYLRKLSTILPLIIFFFRGLLFPWSPH